MIQNLKQPQGNYVRNCWDRATHPHSQRRRRGGCRRVRRVRMRRPWATAGPGRASRRRTQPHSSAPAPLVWRAPEGPEGLAAVPVGGGGAWPGFETTRRAKLTARTASGRVPPTGTPSSPAQQGTPSSPAQQAAGYAKGAGTEVPAPCRFTQPLPRRGLRPDDRQSWRRRRIHRNMPPTTAAPRPAPPIRPSKPVRARPFFGLVAGTSGAT